MQKTLKQKREEKAWVQRRVQRRAQSRAQSRDWPRQASSISDSHGGLSNLNRRVDAVATIEFAFIAPIFFFIMLSMVSLYTQGSAQREVQQTTASLSDLASRYVYMDPARILALGATAEAMLQSTPSLENVRLAVASFYNAPQSTGGQFIPFYFVTLWSHAVGGATIITNEEINAEMRAFSETENAWLQDRNETMLFLRLEADYVAPYAIPGVQSDKVIVRKAWVMPRYAKSIAYQDKD